MRYKDDTVIIELFKRCPNCKYHWNDREQFLTDPKVEIIGYQANFAYLESGLFLFNHQDCETTMAIAADEFVDLYKGPRYKKRMIGSEQCPGHCLHKDSLASCPVECECSYIRDIAQVLKRWPKRDDPF